MKIINIVGARPQFIKYFSVSREIKKFNNTSGLKIRDVLVHTGQHYDYAMSKIFFEELGIKKPDYHLGAGSGSHGEQIERIVRKAEAVLVKEKPDMVLVYGDTNSTLGGALAAAKLHIPIAHIEAGLRSYNKRMAEEVNRVLTDHISAILFCPSRRACLNLKKEGFENIVNSGRLLALSGRNKNIRLNPDSPVVVNVGDVMHEALIYSAGMAKKKTAILQKFNLKPRAYYLLTVHRAENTDNPGNFEAIIKFVNKISAKKTVIFPIHPRAKKAYYKGIKKKFFGNVILIEPVGYFEMLALLRNSSLLLTDSGGMQKEAYWLGIPCVTLRSETEWPETLKGGWNVLMKNYKGFKKPGGRRERFYGDGKASERIAGVLTKWIKNL